MAEWLGRALQKLLQRFESARCLKTPFYKWGFLLHVDFFIFTIMETEIIMVLMTYTLFPLIAWGFLWLMDKLEHIFVEKYFEWTFRVERPKLPFKTSLKKLYKCVIDGDFKKSKKHLKDISRSGAFKFIVAYFLGVILFKFSYSWLQLVKA